MSGTSGSPLGFTTGQDQKIDIFTGPMKSIPEEMDRTFDRTQAISGGPRDDRGSGF